MAGPAGRQEYKYKGLPFRTPKSPVQEASIPILQHLYATFAPDVGHPVLNRLISTCKKMHAGGPIVITTRQITSQFTQG